MDLISIVQETPNKAVPNVYIKLNLKIRAAELGGDNKRKGLKLLSSFSLTDVNIFIIREENFTEAAFR